TQTLYQALIAAECTTVIGAGPHELALALGYAEGGAAAGSWACCCRGRDPTVRGGEGAEISGR
ncbi:MAG: hypothetical protein JWM15_3132, partial [Cryptosporangiaceae bacterium]|nr:hypothetical protein [Cryptosporangiaceae bacterium]